MALANHPEPTASIPSWATPPATVRPDIIAMVDATNSRDEARGKRDPSLALDGL